MGQLVEIHAFKEASLYLHLPTLRLYLVKLMMVWLFCEVMRVTGLRDPHLALLELACTGIWASIAPVRCFDSMPLSFACPVRFACHGSIPYCGLLPCGLFACPVPYGWAPSAMQASCMAESGFE